MENSILIHKIAEALLGSYEDIFYINIASNDYAQYRVDHDNRKLILIREGDDFFEDMAKDCLDCIAKEDQHFILNDLKKQNLLDRLKKGETENIEYRMMVNNEPVYYSIEAIHELRDNDDYLILGLRNIDDIVKEKLVNEKQAKDKLVFNQIADSLASRYDVVYYVDTESGEYAGFVSNSIYGNLEIGESGSDFFEDSIRNAAMIIHPDDLARVRRSISKDFMLEHLNGSKQYSFSYRMIVEGVLHFTRINAFWASDNKHFIIGVENIDDEVRREKEQADALSEANEKANKDELTGLLNKNAYQELEKEIQANMDCDKSYEYGFIMSDLNYLKAINDSLGHSAGDEYLCSYADLLSSIFTHSLVFRIGGDEYLVYLKGDDYKNREDLFEELESVILENNNKKSGPVAAIGLATYEKGNDKTVFDVFDRSDRLMYENKRILKRRYDYKDDNAKGNTEEITETAKARLDSLYGALKNIAYNGYVYLCNMRYDYSRWSHVLVEKFDLPSRYMYGAGKLWEEKVVEEDRALYNKEIEDIFFGEHNSHYLEYRVLDKDGIEHLCHCKGSVIRNEFGDPEYFCGVIQLDD